MLNFGLKKIYNSKAYDKIFPNINHDDTSFSS